MSNEWYYAVEGTSIGPFDQGAFDQLVADGTVHRDTLVWQEGMEDWLPYSRAGAGQGGTTASSATSHGDMHDPARADANTFLGALKDGFARYVDFKTRSTRAQFWWWFLWSFIFGVVATLLDFSIGAGDTGPVNILVSLATFLPSLAVGIRRLHDIGRTGWWVLLMFIPVLGWIVLLVFYCTKTQEQPNQWGPIPQHG
jgi:uncharacterized membrane protein YhaH (DUF805 family)